MIKYGIEFEGEDELIDELFDTEDAAEDYALYLRSCYREGAEILHMSNPGDYEYDEDTYEAPDFQIVEVEV